MKTMMFLIEKQFAEKLKAPIILDKDSSYLYVKGQAPRTLIQSQQAFALELNGDTPLTLNEIAKLPCNIQIRIGCRRGSEVRLLKQLDHATYLGYCSIQALVTKDYLNQLMQDPEIFLVERAECPLFINSGVKVMPHMYEIVYFTEEYRINCEDILSRLSILWQRLDARKHLVFLEEKKLPLVLASIPEAIFITPRAIPKG